MGERDQEKARTYLRAWRERNPGKVRASRARHAESARTWAIDNPEKVRAKAQAWRKRNPKKVREQRLTRYGITLRQYEEMLAAQGGCCAFCGAKNAAGRRGTFHVDHDHETGRVRGLLCHRCNVSKVGSNTLETAKKLVLYLQTSQEPLGATQTVAP